MLEQARAILPAGCVITSLSDRGFVHERLLHYLRSQQWHGSPAIDGQDADSPVGSVGCRGERARSRGTESTASSSTSPSSQQPLGRLIWLWPVPLNIPMTAFIVASDEPASALTLDEYALRFEIEGAFLDEKSGGRPSPAQRTYHAWRRFHASCSSLRLPPFT